MALCRLTLVYISNVPRAGARAEMKIRALKAVEVAVEVPLPLIEAFSACLSLSVRARLRQDLSLAM